MSFEKEDPISCCIGTIVSLLKMLVIVRTSKQFQDHFGWRSLGRAFGGSKFDLLKDELPLLTRSGLLHFTMI